MLYKIFKILRQQLMEWFTLKLYFPLVFKVYKPSHKPLNRADLNALPQNSLGKQLVFFLDKHGLDFIEGYELHDVKHLLINYGIGFEDEIQMQYFELGNGNRSLPVWFVVVWGTLLAPEFAPQYKAAYRKGKACRPLTPDFLLQNIHTNLHQLQQQLYSTQF